MDSWIPTSSSGLVMLHVSLVFLRIDQLHLPHIFDVLETLLVLGGIEDFIKLVLHFASFLQRPVAVFLVAEDDVVQDRPGDAETEEHVLVGVGTLGAQGCHLVAVRQFGLDGGV